MDLKKISIVTSPDTPGDGLQSAFTKINQNFEDVELILSGIGGGSWEEIEDKPLVFPPDDHIHSADDITSGVLHVDRVPTLSITGKTSGTLTVARGGTGATTFTANSFLVGDGTSAVKTRTPVQVLGDIGAAAASHTHDAGDIDMNSLIGALIIENPGDVFDERLRTVQLLSPMNLNSLPARSGWYRVLASGSTNIPSGAGGRLLIEQVFFSTTDIMQRCTRTSNGDVWQRTKADSTWTIWQKLN